LVDGLLRSELGYDGLVIADALEMKGLSEAVGVERGAVLALRAGVDALLIGHDLGEEAVQAVQAALVAAVAAGELPEERLREAAARVDRVAAHASPSHVRGQAPDMAAGDRSAARVVARRALEVHGAPTLPPSPLVVELRPEANMAAGEAEHSLGAVLAGRIPGARSVVLDEGGPAPDGRPDVVVVRDAHRHEWMRDLTGRLSPAVVVEVGVPVWRPDGPAWIATHGGSRVSYEALADLLGAAVPAGAGA